MNRQRALPIPRSALRTIAFSVPLLLLAIVAGPALRAQSNSPAPAKAGSEDSVSIAEKLGVGAWIWTTNTSDKQTCRLWRSFEVPAEPRLARATLRITADNGYRVFLDGREIGRGGDWKYLTEFDLTSLMSPGAHVLAVEAFNDSREAGVLLGAQLQFADGRKTEFFSDPSWSVAPGDDSHWQTRRHPDASWFPAKIIGFVGQHPWERLIDDRDLILAPPSLPAILHFWQQTWFLILLLTVCTGVVVLCVRQAAQLAVHARAQRMLERERARIARDIHDDLGARLTQLVLLGEVARTQLPADTEARTQVEQVCEKARDLSHAMDEVIWAVNSRRDTLRDFASYVCKHAQLFLAPTPIRCRLDVEPEIPAVSFDLPVRRNLFLAIKEALNNAAKHSGANELFVRIHRRENELVVAIEDNGKGFELAEANLERNGMTNMSQRLGEAGGRCRVSSEPGRGCRVEFVVPLTRGSRFAKWFRRRQPETSVEPGRFAHQPRVTAHASDSAPT